MIILLVTILFPADMLSSILPSISFPVRDWPRQGATASSIIMLVMILIS
jgi:hypothetical protein